MTQKTAEQFSPELRERAVRMVQGREREGGTQRVSIGHRGQVWLFARDAQALDQAGRAGCRRNAQRLRLGERPGLTTV